MTFHSQSETNGTVSYADGFPILVAAEESLKDLNDRLSENGADAVSMDRFRPNVVVNGMAAWSEDWWTKVTVNGVILHAVKPCDRCKVPTIEQSTGVLSGPEPTQTMKTFRTGRHLGLDKEQPSWKDAVFFGMNLIPENEGSISVGDFLTLLRVKKLPPGAVAAGEDRKEERP